MEWTKQVPKKPGKYFRNNPPCSHVVRQDIFEMDERLWASGCEGAQELSKWHGAKSMWWFGPIPEVPIE